MDVKKRGMVWRFGSIAAASLFVCQLGAAEPGNSYAVQNLVSDGSVPALHKDPLLINAWGIAIRGNTPWWVADNGMNVSTLYNAMGIASSLVVQVPGAPTGAVSYSGSGFVVSNGDASGPAFFLFATESGTILGCMGVPLPAPSKSAVTVVPNASAPAHGAVYKGLAVAQTQSGDFLYAADFHNNRVDVFDSTFHPVTTPGAFVDPRLPKGYAPFGIQNIQNRILVWDAKQDEEAHDEIDGDGFGFIDADPRLRHVPRAHRVARRPQCSMGNGHGAGQLRPIQQHAARR